MEVLVDTGFCVFSVFLWAVGAGFVIFFGVVGLLVCVGFEAVAADFGPFPDSGVFLLAVGAGFVVLFWVVGLLVCVGFEAVAADFGPFPDSGVVGTLGFAVFSFDVVCSGVDICVDWFEPAGLLVATGPLSAKQHEIDTRIPIKVMKACNLILLTSFLS